MVEKGEGEVHDLHVHQTISIAFTSIEQRLKGGT